jgi:hypothetical protein
MPQRQPHQFTVTEARLNTIAIYLTPAVKLLDDINDAFGSSFLQPISKTTFSLIVEVQVTIFLFRCDNYSLSLQKVKRNRDECIRLLENILQVLYAIVNLHIKSAGSLSPLLVDDMGKFTEYTIWAPVSRAGAERISAEPYTRYTHSLRHNKMEARSSTSFARVR